MNKRTSAKSPHQVTAAPPPQQITAVKSLRQMRALAKAFAAVLSGLDGAAVLFDAPMGAGKTAFISAVIANMDSSVRVSSPTFTVINKYTERIYHADLYRVKGADIENTGIYDMLAEPSNFVFVEWAGELVLPNAAGGGETGRRAGITAGGQRTNMIKIKINVLEGGGREFIIT